MKKKISDPTCPPAELVIDGTTYRLCFDFASLAEAESYYCSRGHDINLLTALPRLNLFAVQTIFPCALRRYHPEITFEQAQAMVNIGNVFAIASAIAEAWQRSMPVAENPERPPEAAVQ